MDGGITLLIPPVPPARHVVKVSCFTPAVIKKLPMPRNKRPALEHLVSAGMRGGGRALRAERSPGRPKGEGGSRRHAQSWHTQQMDHRRWRLDSDSGPLSVDHCR